MLSISKSVYKTKLVFGCIRIKLTKEPIAKRLASADKRKIAPANKQEGSSTSETNAKVKG